MEKVKCLGRSFYIQMITKADVNSSYISWLNDPETNKYLEVRHRSISLEEQMDYIDSFDQKEKVIFGIYPVATMEMIGTISLNIDILHNKGVYGYLIGEKEYLGTSAGIDACCLLMDYAFYELKLDKVTGGVYANNIGSLFNFKKLGFVKEGVLKKEYLLDGERVDAAVFALFPDSWSVRRKEIGYL